MNSNENNSSEERNFTNRNHYSEYSNGNTLNNGNNIPVSFYHYLQKLLIQEEYQMNQLLILLEMI